MFCASSSKVIGSSYILFTVRRRSNITTVIMYQHTGIGDVVGMEISDFEVVSRFGRFELLQRYAFYFAKRAVGKKDFIAML